MPLKPFQRLAALSFFVLLALLAIVLVPLRTPAPAVATSRPLRDKLPRPFDAPGEAQEFYRLKRAPHGQRGVPVERYLQALVRMRFMPQYSTARRAVLPSRGELALRGVTLDETAGLSGWTPLGPGNVGGRTRALVIDPHQPRTLYAGGVAGGVWKSIDGAASWRPLTDLLPNLAIGSLAMDPAHSNVLYAGTGEGYFNGDAARGAGIFRTINGGVTWQQLTATANNPDFYYVNDIKISARNSLRVYAATGTGVFRSLNGGATWTRVYATTARGGCLDLALRTDKTTDTLFASCGTFRQAFVVRNTAAEGSGAWTVVLNDPQMSRTSLAIAPSNQNVIYALAASSAPGTYNQGLLAVFRSTTGGAAGSWTAQVRNTDPAKLNTLLLTNPLVAYSQECGVSDSDVFNNHGWYDNAIAVDPKDPNRVWVGGVDLFRSDDAGKSWGLASSWWRTPAQGNQSYVHADQHVIVFPPQYNGTTVKSVFVGNDGGLFKNLDARTQTVRTIAGVCNPALSPAVWQSLNNGYAVTQFYDGKPYPDGKRYLGGTQDNGTVRGADTTGANHWSQILGGDGGFVAVHPTNTDILYAENIGPSLAKSTDGGAQWADATQGIDQDEDYLFIVPFAMDPADPQRLWLGGTRLWRTTDGAASWSPASAPVPGSEFSQIVSAVAIDPSNANHVLAGTFEGFIVRSDSALTGTESTEWQSSQPQEGYVSAVAIDPTNGNVAYATYSTFGTTHVWKSTDGGTTWTALDGTGSGALPDLPVQSVAVDPAHPSNLYLGTDLGVFSSIDGGAHWMVENTGFANAATDALAVRKGSGGQRDLFAFSHGRGAWRVALPN